MELGLKGKVAIVTGGSKGLGRAIAQELAAEGANVVICARHEETLRQVAAEIASSTGSEALPVVADMTSAQDIERLVEETIARFGRVDILVNNATSEPYDRYDSLSDELWTATFEVKLLGYVRCCRAVLPHMRAQGGGRIINIAGDAGPQPVTWHMPGGAVNAALLNFTKALSTVVAEDNILVTAVNPAATFTPRWQEIIDIIAAQRGKSPDDIYQFLVEEIPLKRSSTPEEISAVVAFLASDRATFITGSAINVDGGRIRGM